MVSEAPKGVYRVAESVKGKATAKMKRTVIAASIVTCIIGLAGALMSCDPKQGSSLQLNPLRVQWGWIPDAHHAGFYVALEKGFYRRLGLEITFLPGRSDSNPIKAIVSGAADIGQAGGVEQIISAKSKGVPILAFAAIHRDTPHALISLERNPIRKPADLPGKRIGIAYGDAAELLFKAYLSRAAIDQKSMTFEPFRFDLQTLVDGKIDAITGFKTDQPITLMAQGLKPIVLSYSSIGIKSYGYTLFTTEEFRNKNPEAIVAFHKGSREGFEYAFAHPEEAIAITKKALAATFDNIAEQKKLEAVSILMLDPSGKLADWSLDPAMIRQVESYLKDQGQLKKVPAPESVFKNIDR